MTNEQRKIIHNRFRFLAIEAKFEKIKTLLDRSQLGNDMERQHVLSEYVADYHKFDYSVYPRYAMPRLPRSRGMADD